MDLKGPYLQTVTTSGSAHTHRIGLVITNAAHILSGPHCLLVSFNELIVLLIMFSNVGNIYKFINMYKIQLSTA